ncbi:DUF1963 domain-containing protein [Sphingomonas sp. So64.6b]|uniref:YwqG family protein n=1 Tax=Sphingomonas sp. So64.6b TaxID=2997354 RepID=UPI0016026357|nr:YwqG family protein [Sphingomonas sp. So64.6b]QNA84973.1 DUF1963 domain-containing protein [Sphingomonas sp. So64.6b]
MRRFFSRQAQITERQPSTVAATLLAEMEREALPAVVIEHDDGKGASRLGGLPDLPERHAWPIWRDAPLAFLAQLDCSEIRAANGPAWLPDQGVLFFFYNAEQETWGFDPEDQGSWAVIYDSAATRDNAIKPPTDLKLVFEAVPLRFRSIASMPSVDRIISPHDTLEDADWDHLYDARAALFGGNPHHQVGGFADPVQGDDMELDCQLTSNGIYLGSGDGYRSPEARSLKAGKGDWRLLLQLDTDDKADMMWGDAGMLYFWVRERDALAKEFGSTWMILQCS